MIVSTFAAMHLAEEYNHVHVHFAANDVASSPSSKSSTVSLVEMFEQSNEAKGIFTIAPSVEWDHLPCYVRVSAGFHKLFQQVSQDDSLRVKLDDLEWCTCLPVRLAALISNDMATLKAVGVVQSTVVVPHLGVVHITAHKYGGDAERYISRFVVADNAQAQHTVLLGCEFDDATDSKCIVTQTVGCDLPSVLRISHGFRNMCMKLGQEFVPSDPNFLQSLYSGKIMEVVKEQFQILRHTGHFDTVIIHEGTSINVCGHVLSQSTWLITHKYVSDNSTHRRMGRIASTLLLPPPPLPLVDSPPSSYF